MNFPERKKRLEQITQKNYQLYERLRNVDSTVQTFGTLKKSMKQAKIMRSICKFDKEGQKKGDPLVEMHKFHGTGSPGKTHSSGFKGSKLNRTSTDSRLAVLDDKVLEAAATDDGESLMPQSME